MPLQVYADRCLKEAKIAILDSPMRGNSGDMPEKREWIATVIGQVEQMVRSLAKDAAFDHTLAQEDWDTYVDQLRECVK